MLLLLACTAAAPDETPKRPADTSSVAPGDEGEVVFDEEHLLLVTSMDRVDAFTVDGARTHTWRLSELVGRGAFGRGGRSELRGGGRRALC